MDGLPIFKPPYARVTAFDMNTGEHLWTAPVGNGPRNHPALKGLDLPPLGDAIDGDRRAGDEDAGLRDTWRRQRPITAFR